MKGKTGSYMCGKGDAVREKACNRKLHDNRLCRAYRRKLCGEREGKRVMKKVIAIMAVMTIRDVSADAGDMQRLWIYYQRLAGESRHNTFY